MDKFTCNRPRGHAGDHWDSNLPPIFGKVGWRAEPVETNKLSVCAWCPGLNILECNFRDTDTLVLVAHKNSDQLKPLHVTAWLSGKPLLVSHGICPACRVKLQGGHL